MQLILDIFEGDPPPAQLWTDLSDEERTQAVATLARLIAKTVLPEEDGGE